jgi:hypothetical protein
MAVVGRLVFLAGQSEHSDTVTTGRNLTGFRRQKTTRERWFDSESKLNKSSNLL